MPDTIKPLLKEGKNFTIEFVVELLNKGMKYGVAFGAKESTPIEELQALYIEHFDKLFRHTKDKLDDSITLSENPTPEQIEALQCTNMQTMIRMFAFEIQILKHYHPKRIRLNRDDQRELDEKLSRGSNDFPRTTVEAETCTVENKTERNALRVERARSIKDLYKQLFTMKSLCKLYLKRELHPAMIKRIEEAKDARMKMQADTLFVLDALIKFMSWPADKEFVYNPDRANLAELAPQLRRECVILPKGARSCTLQ